MAAIYDLAAEVMSLGHTDPDYAARMLHKIPDATSVDRAKYLLDAARGKSILDVGASGPMSEALKKVARAYKSVNIVDADYWFDLDKVDALPEIPGLELVIAGEVLEHLSLPGHFMELLQKVYRPVIITVPNAFSEIGYRHILRGTENVNLEHVAYYSYYTFLELAGRYDFAVVDWHWYNGKPYTAEGMIFKLE